MKREAHLRGEGGVLGVRAMAYEFPGLDTGHDANWVSGEVALTSLRAGRFVASSGPRGINLSVWWSKCPREVASP